uniref:thioredoxin domain-containing protein n=3 Tax=unclassified Providencia TaxID=2633465 RepID=UPI00234BA60F
QDHISRDILLTIKSLYIEKNLLIKMMLLGLFAIHSLLIIANIEAVPQNQYRQTRSQSGLYSTSDGVVILTANNFNENIYNSPSASVVQFYNSPSDHCVKYAPVYKQLASSVQNWRNVIKVAVIDCSDSQNAQICQQYGINDYPAIRYFQPQQKSQTTGTPISKDLSDPASIRGEILNQLAKTEPKIPNFPDFSPVNADNYESLQEQNTGGLLILVVEKEDSHLGHELMMDLFGVGVRNVAVRSSHNQKLSNAKEQLPQIFVLKTGYPAKQLTMTNPTRHRVFKLVQSYLIKEGYNVPDNTEMHGNAGQNSSQNSEPVVINEQTMENSKRDDKVAQKFIDIYGLYVNSMTASYQDKLQKDQKDQKDENRQ